MTSEQRSALLNDARRWISKGAFGQAQEPCRQLLDANAADTDALCLKAQIDYAIGSLDAAEGAVRKLFELRPGNPEDHCMLAAILSRQERVEEALGQYDQAARLNPSSTKPAMGKAELLMYAGRSEEARAALQPLIDQGADDSAFGVLLGTIEENAGQYDKAVGLAQRYTSGANANPPAINRQLYFLMGRSLEKLERYDDAFDAFVRGNGFGALPFDHRRFGQYIDHLIEVFSKKNMRSMPRSSHDSELPVFIASMPRSGSTLVEQIVGAHSQAIGVGEINIINRVAINAPAHLKTQRPYPECISMVTRKGMTQLGDVYLEEAEKLASDHARLADKTLQAWQHVGLIQHILPDSRVIYVRRNPMDTCLSCFMAALTPDVHVFASNFKDLAFYYKQHDRLVKHWLKSASLEQLEVQYEELVEQPEELSRQIIEFCELDWEDECLRFHQKKDRLVMTLSYEQVRKPIYKSAMQRWKKYEKHLGELRAELADVL